MTTVSERTEVRFASGSDECHAWLYLPRDVPSVGVPVVVMAHGFGGTKEFRLNAFAEVFRDAGCACLVFDYRHFGESTGQPRELIDVPSQLEDWRSAVAFARSLPQIDADQVVLWGTSFAGGHVIATAADDPLIAGVITQCPFTDGLSSVRTMPLKNSVKLMARALSDITAHWRGRDPARVPIIAEPGQLGIMTTPDAILGRQALERAAGVEMPRLVPARVVPQVGRYFPGRRAKDVQCPIMFCICESDSVAPAPAAVRYAAKAPLGEIRLYQAGHFEIYLGTAFAEVVADQVRFLQAHVRIPAPSPNAASPLEKEVTL